MYHSTLGLKEGHLAVAEPFRGILHDADHFELGMKEEGRVDTPYTLHPSPYTPHPVPYTPLRTPYTNLAVAEPFRGILHDAHRPRPPAHPRPKLRVHNLRTSTAEM